MKTRSAHGFWTVILMLASPLLAVVSFPSAAQAQTFKVLYSFTGGADGGRPYAALLFDSTGNLYGTTWAGGDAGCSYFACGVVFELTPNSGGWSETVLHTFTGGSDGGNPRAALIFDASGNLYGTTEVGGVSGCTDYGCGVAFELTPTSDGWDETVLYTFSQSGSGGGDPVAGLVFDKHGNLYSTLPIAGSEGSGTAYELSEDMGVWTQETLYEFGNGGNGCEPASAPILDAAGNVYGTTASCGGAVWELSRGSWKEKNLHTFKGPGGSDAWSGLVFDKAGNLYGTTRAGGKYDKGVVFKLTLGAKGKWKETVLYGFKGASDGGDGDDPLAAPIFDKAGNIYGTTSQGGDPACTPENGYGCGTVFKLTPGKGGQWKETVLHRFTGGSDGASPSGLIFDAAGDLYGTAFFGGNAGCYSGGGCGVVFEITP